MNTFRKIQITGDKSDPVLKDTIVSKNGDVLETVCVNRERKATIREFDAFHSGMGWILDFDRKLV